MTIYFDMDGVLCDFEARCDELDCWKPDIHKCNWKKMEENRQFFLGRYESDSTRIRPY